MSTVDPQKAGFRELLSRTQNDATHLMRSEVELAKRETKEQVDIVQKRAAAAAVAGAVAHMAGILILFGIALLLDAIMPLWLSVLLVGIVASAAAGALALRQKQKLAQMEPAPKRAMERTKDDYAAVKEAAQ